MSEYQRSLESYARQKFPEISEEAHRFFLEASAEVYADDVKVIYWLTYRVRNQYQYCKLNDTIADIIQGILRAKVQHSETPY